MKKRSKKLLSLFLSAMMVFSVVPATVYAEPAAEETTAEQTADQEDNTEAAQDDVDAEKADTTAEETDKDSSKTEAATDNGVATQAENNETKATTSTVTGSIDLSGIKFGGANAAVADNMVKDQDVKIDESDPTVAQLKKELENIEIVGGEAEDTDSRAAVATYAAEDESDTSKEKKPLTDEQIQKVLAMFQQYQDQWKKNADVLGAQMPFYLSYNDDNDDGLGVLGEMLVLAGISVDDVRSGEYTYDDVTGMILNFQFGDQYGVEYYGNTVKSVRDKGLEAVKKSGAKTEVQKLLALNDYLAQIDTFDMAYIMNSSDKDSDTPTMQAPTPTKNEHWDTMYKAVYAVYEDSIKETFENKIKDGLFDNATKQALRQTDACKDMTDEEFSAFLETEDGKAMYNGYYDNVKNSITNDGMDVPMEDGTTVHMTLDQIVAAQMDTAMDDLGGMTPNQAIPEYAKQAATKLTDGIVNYWEGTQIGAMALGKSVCLGYSKAYAYMIQCMHSDIYTTDGNIDNASSWKTAKDLYYAEDGKTIDIDKDYVVDLVRITFDTSVTMYGTKNNGFNSDHFWNAVKVDGKWYYVDPCYSDVYTEVMSRNRGEVDGSMNHMYFMFSDTSARKMYDGYFSENDGLKSLYKGVATDKTYETAWPARIKSTTSFDGEGNAYYSYSSQDLFSMVSSDNPDYSKMADTQYKIVQHKMGDTLKDDQDDGDSDYNTLIYINKEAEDSNSSKSSKASSSWGSSSSNKNYVAQVYNPETKTLEDNDVLTKAVKQYMNDAAIYPSIFTSSYYYEGKVYFNISNAIYTYDMKTGKVAQVKEYNEVTGHRDATEAFGAGAFSIAEPAKDANMDITVNNAPIAGFTIKDGKMHVSIATNYGWVSGRTQHDVYSDEADEKGNYSMLDDVKKTYGYEFQESNYNQSYSNYQTSFVGNNEKNDNDEFMWTACIEDEIDMSHFDAAEDTHTYEKVTVAPTCGKNGYTEERCKTCGKIKEGTRKEEKDTALDHHYVHYNETYYTKTDDKWNTGESYVCVDCGYAVQSDDDDDGLNSDKSVLGAKDTYALAKEKAGHTYAPVKEDAVDWASEKDGKITLAKDTDVSCTDCSTKKLDCLQDYEEAGKTITAKTDKDITLDVTTSHTGTCDKGVTTVYKASGKDDNNNTITATKSEKAEAGQHQYEGKFEWNKVKDSDGNVTDKYKASVSDVKCSVCGDEPKDDQITVTTEKNAEKSKDATCEAAGVTVWTATVTVKAADSDTVIGTFTKDKEVTIDALGHKYGDPEFTWTKGDNNTYTVKAKRTCKNDASHVEEVDAKVTEKTDGASCTEAGKITYTATATFDGKDYTDTKTEEVEALGHNYGEPEWKWSKGDDGSYTAVAVFTCTRCKDEQQELGKVTSERTEPTCEEKGKVVYTAKATFEGKEYTGTKTVELKAKGHSYGDPTFNWTKGDNNTYTATATFTCKNDASHVETVDAKVTEKTEGASCTEAGKITYTAKATFEDKEYTDKKEEEVAALGHNYDIAEKNGWKWTADKEKGYVVKATFECTRCKDSHVVDATVEKSEVNGETVYTATATYEGVTRTDTKSLNMSVSYVTHVQDIGWEADKDNASAWKKDGAIAGTTGKAKQLEAIKIKLPDGVSGSVEYYSHVQDKGWEKAWSHKDGEESGTTGSFKKLEAIKIRLSGNVADNYDIYYRVHAENFGWLGWAKNGESAGTAGYNYRLEAIQIVLVKKGETANLPSDPKSNYEDSMVSRLVKYQAHVRDLGDQAVVYDGATCGTVGKAKPVEALRISLPSLPDGTIKYDAHVENIGWQNKWAKNGEMIGTKGRALQIEAIKIDLDGSVKDEYDIYYRVHSANVGWLGWAKNGEEAGTAGFAYGVEAVQIKLVKKGTTPNLPASANAKAYIKK